MTGNGYSNGIIECWSAVDITMVVCGCLPEPEAVMEFNARLPTLNNHGRRWLLARNEENHGGGWLLAITGDSDDGE